MKSWLEHHEPLCTKIHQYFCMPKFSIGERLAILCRSSLMRSVQSFELDENCMLTKALGDDILRSDQITRLTHIRISFSDFDQCVDLLNELGSQLQSFTVNIGYVSDYAPSSSSNIRSVNNIS